VRLPPDLNNEAGETYLPAYFEAPRHWLAGAQTEGEKMSHAFNPARLELVRHGESMAQFSRRVEKRAYSGDEDPPLSELGRRQALTAGWARRAQPQPDVIIASGLTRAQETAALFMEGAGWNVPIAVNEAFNEQSYGIMAHLDEDEQRARFPAEAQRKFQQGFWFFRPPQGESWQDVAVRMRPALAELYGEHTGKHVMVFGHSTGNQLLRLLIEGLTPQQLLEIDLRLSTNCSITTYVQDESGKMGLVAAYYRPTTLIELV
jgi:broad specificity phosphatase PhoE